MVDENVMFGGLSVSPHDQPAEASRTWQPAANHKIQCIQFFFSKTLFDFKKSISGLIELKFSRKTPNEVLYAPIYFWGVYF